MHLDHVGIATRDAAGLAAALADLFAVPIAREETFDDTRIAFVDAGHAAAGATTEDAGTGENTTAGTEVTADAGGPYLELLEPTDDDGPVVRFLDREGAGLHHVALATADAAHALDRARGMGIEPIDDEPRPGAWGHDVAFLRPDDTGGVLVEFVEH